MFKKIIKLFLWILVLFLALLIFIGIIRPAYVKYKEDKPKVIVDTSGERATSKTKEKKSSDKNIESTDLGDAQITFDDRILLYEGNVDAENMIRLMNILIEDIDSKIYSKVDINLNEIDISYKDKENYRVVLNNFKNSIKKDSKYFVEFKYNKLKTVVNKIIIKSM